MGIREAAFNEQNKRIKESISCRKLADVRRFINKRLNYLENKTIKDIQIELYAEFNDRKWEDYE